MAKPSSTNNPNAFRRPPLYVFCPIVFFQRRRESGSGLSRILKRKIFWWFWSRCSPLPIPNREVKPDIADDTALVCGKVGRRQSFTREPGFGFPFFVPARAVPSAAVPPGRHGLLRDKKCDGLCSVTVVGLVVFLLLGSL